MSKLIIACMDGASASFRNRHIRTYMSDVVDECLLGTKWYIKVNENSEDRMGISVPYIHKKSVRGGAIFSRQRKIRRFIDEHNQVGNVLLCVGKSYGGYNLIEMLKEFMDWSNYSRVVLFLVDACSLDKIIGQKELIQPPKVDEIYNWYQTNNRHMNGYKMESTVNNLYQNDLSDVPGVNHWTITESLTVKRELTRVITSLI